MYFDVAEATLADLAARVAALEAAPAVDLSGLQADIAAVQAACAALDARLDAIAAGAVG
jgi:uncharacterized protein YceH (UPF0502 family)